MPKQVAGRVSVVGKNTAGCDLSLDFYELRVFPLLVARSVPVTRVFFRFWGRALRRAAKDKPSKVVRVLVSIGLKDDLVHEERVKDERR
ncbi:hypothetical protein BIW11_04620 [Tropilaelaps mercedesae]|uniref:Uncharacterized protein n=1 Tax=Tropilaelaps mercedesae TaxID=418985 RepID=A0A1V9X4E2_9ACAR|nr:hypothetical protein BIW11_04620 [Tropilaelaps mercedesae]